MNMWREILTTLLSDMRSGLSNIHDLATNYPQLEQRKRRRVMWWALGILLIGFLTVLGKAKSVEFMLGGLLAVLAGFFGAHHAGNIQSRRDDSQRRHDIMVIRKALRSEIHSIWETYKTNVGNEIQKYDPITNPYSPERGYVPNLQHCPVLMGVSSKVGLMNAQELDWVNTTYASLSELQHTFEIVETRRKEQEIQPLGGNIRGYKESLTSRVKQAQQNIHGQNHLTSLRVTTTLKLLDRPLDEMGNPNGPGPFEETVP